MLRRPEIESLCEEVDLDGVKREERMRACCVSRGDHISVHVLEWPAARSTLPSTPSTSNIGISPSSPSTHGDFTYNVSFIESKLSSGTIPNLTASTRSTRPSQPSTTGMKSYKDVKDFARWLKTAQQLTKTEHSRLRVVSAALSCSY